MAVTQHGSAGPVNQAIDIPDGAGPFGTGTARMPWVAGFGAGARRPRLPHRAAEDVHMGP
ncbi:hypothetical protein NKH77_02460 [Streptomyces sp. M19]